VFPLSQYADRLRAYHQTAVMSPQLEALAASIIEAGLPDIAVTHPTDWGLPATIPGFEDQRVYVWVEMVPGHMAALAEALSDRGEDPADWRRIWDQADAAQFFGWDNGYFHALLFPALMMAYDPTWRLPAALCANEFLLLDDAKFSTSRGHAIWGGDLLAEAPADAVRFALACDRPQFSRTAFTLARFRGLVDDELAGRWQRGVAGLLDAVDRHCGGRIPDSAAATGSQRRFVAGLPTLAEACLAAYAIEQFDPRAAVRMIVELVRRIADFDDGQSRLRATRPDSAETRAGVAAQAQAVKLLAQLAAPIMPDFAQAVWTALGCEGAPRWDDHAPLRPGQRIGSNRGFLQPLPEDLPARLGR
jgi:methionyl-tRNA synthetase